MGNSGTEVQRIQGSGKMADAAIQLRAYNGQWVCAEGGGGGQVVANRGVPDIWETFSMVPVQGGTLQDGSLVALEVFNGMYVCAEGGGGREVVANRSWRREWETFTLHRIAGQGALQNGDQIALTAYNGMYVCAEGGGGREVVANRSWRREWETFTASVLAPRRVRIELDHVRCSDTEDVTGADEFYAIGAGADRFSGANNTLLSKPFNINNGQTKDFPVESSQRVIFEGTVDAASTIVAGVKFLDEDANHDWSKYGSMVTDLSGKVSTGLALLGPYGKGAGAVLTTVTQAAGLIMSLDQDDLLGDITIELPVSKFPIGTSLYPLTVRGGGGWWSSWNYIVYYKVTVN
jgi:hypothetical protein